MALLEYEVIRFSHLGWVIVELSSGDIVGDMYRSLSDIEEYFESIGCSAYKIV